MRFLSLDVGERRTGVAVSDPGGVIARPLTTLEVPPQADGLAAAVRPLVDEHGVQHLVVGLPRRLSGRHGPEAEAATALASELGALLGLPVTLWDERLSTVEAGRLLDEGGVRGRRRKQRIDAVAAAVILQSFLDHRSSTGTAS